MTLGRKRMPVVNLFKLPFAWALLGSTRALRRGRESLLRSLFARHGRNLRFDPDGYYTFHNIEVGDDVIFGRGAILMAAKSRIFIGNKVMFGPEAMIIGGNHNTSVAGRAMFDVREKRPSDDQDVIIEDDVWVGARAVILKGVIVRRGAVVGAGAVVTKEVPAYAIVTGNPAKVIRFRGNIDEILTHERMLYPREERLPEDYLQRAQSQALDSRIPEAQPVIS